jgi:ABC-2 type transport system permease protein
MTRSNDDSAPAPTAPSGHARRTVRRRPAFEQLLRTELRLFIREPMALFWGVAFPVVLLAVLGIATSSKPQHSLGGVKFIVAYTPVVMVFSLTILALNAPAPALAAYREKGYLRRLSTTPVGAWRLLAVEGAIKFRATRAAASA